MKVLVGCEQSGIVCGAFRDRGHKAYSCDLLPPAKTHRYARYHLKCDVREQIGYDWDLFIVHPDCTYLCASGLHWNKRGALVDGRPRAELTEEALDFVREMMDSSAHIPRFCLENSRGCIGTRITPKTQTIQPFQFGHDASKTTDLWLDGLPKLVGTTFVPPRLVCGGCGAHLDYAAYVGPCAWVVNCEHCGAGPGLFKPRWANQTDSGQNKLGPSADRWMLRAETYTGIAEAMADQWGST